MSGWIIPALAGLLAGMAGAMGLGGGSVLLLYLTLGAGVSQLAAQGINLMFFLPCALASTLLAFRKGLIAGRKALFAVVAGVPGAIAGCFLAGMLGDRLRPMFGVYMLVLGLRELLRKEKSTQNNHTPPPRRIDI